LIGINVFEEIEDYLRKLLL